MKYFTPELFVLYQSEDDAIADEADRLWEEAVERYAQQLESLLPQAPEGLRQLFGNYYLHDAPILSLGQQDRLFVIVLRLDPPYRDLVLTYTLTEDPVINRSALPPEYCSRFVQWLHDEVELVSTDPVVCDHAILLSNGWELRLRFSDLQVTAFRSLLLTESRQRRADECERNGLLLAQEDAAASLP